MNDTTPAHPTATGRAALCPTCAVRHACFGNGSSAEALQQLDEAVERRIRLQAGEYLYRIGDRFRSLYAVRAGSLKHSLRDAAGRAQVMGFHIRGDIVGVAGIEPQAYMFDMQALEPSEVCELPFDRIEALAAQVPSLRHSIVKVFGRYRNRDARTQFLRRKGGAEARVAGFLVDFSQHLEARGLDPAAFRLHMDDADIASYLGLEAADVERELARLGERGFATVSGRMVAISAREALQSLAASGD